MKTTFNLNHGELASRGAEWTAREIVQQPSIWRHAMSQGVHAAASFVAAQLATPNLRIIFTGAGTSAFIGECLAPAVAASTRLRIEAISTTDLVSGPGLHFRADIPTLLVSFARSGSSPESLAAIELADRFVPDCRHLVFTCNPQGELALSFSKRDANKSLVQLLPAETLDRGFAMTSSFSTMLLSAASAFGLVDHGEVLCDAGEALLTRAGSLARGWVEGGFRRVVYLGSNELKGLAHEAALKLLELSDGRVVSLHDSPLGFRHGPKTVVDERTLIVMFISNDPYVQRYDLDLLRELRRDGRAGRVVAIGGELPSFESHENDVRIPGADLLSDLELVPLFVLIAQTFALLQSLELGLTPDNPSVSGTVNRVVQGVTIHATPSMGSRNALAH